MSKIIRLSSIIYIVPYFGKLPENFNLWLYTCKYNPTIDWIIFTDDKTKYNYPKNVIVKYMSFEELKIRIQQCFSFNIDLKTPYKLCDFKVAYGEIFSKEIEGYDFWGYCDIDLMWGDIRSFINEDILMKYERIGFQGHSTLYRNDPIVNSRYRTLIGDESEVEKILNSESNMFYDENIINKLYKEHNIEFYSKTIFANISPLEYSFYLRYFPNEMDYKNKHQIFIWEKGKLYRLYCVNNKIYKEEFMYIHFLRRYMKCMIKNIYNVDRISIIPNRICIAPDNIDANYIIRNSKNRMLLYYIDLIKRKWKKVSIKNIFVYFTFRIKSKKVKKQSNEVIV